jgi:hypothetical protein
MAATARPSDKETFIQPQNRPTERQRAAIGTVATMWSVMELLIERLIARLSLAPSLMGYVLTNRLGANDRTSAIDSLLTIHRQRYRDEFLGSETRVAIKSMLPKITTMREDRNSIVHSVWVNLGSDLMARMNISAAARSGKDMSTSKPDSVTDIEGFAVTIQTACDQLHSLTNRIPSIDATWLDKLQKREQQNRRANSPRSMYEFRRRPYTKL